ncbi:putative C6 transcription factor [Aspergillus clavatus NRRL 1]|uniref:C6 transcription factor, putative n=1 Tax=Aspergillus clavatus (strain ATCC 1007 / CBS 513.65 / DSM 816 / NCTC 3887 / NRRL 1 / QM 1276 / 107) TaxID=344612 RepID=A1CC74_ASPCL|nr:C6 transcription factor, putative [Aspergillus clavatus NRRL 1]EAW12131.1 C6 transcription factor, putative [Aspergillus clavatus NRRL 1]
MDQSSLSSITQDLDRQSSASSSSSVEKQPFQFLGVHSQPASVAATPSPAAKLPIPRLSSTPISRHRTSRACVPCRERKIKCDGAKPTCKQCHQLKITCAYAGSKRERQQLELETTKAKVNVYESLLRKIYEKSREERLTSIEEVFNKYFEASPELFTTFLSSRPISEQGISLPRPVLSLNRMRLTWASKKGDKTLPLCQEPDIQITNIKAWTTLVDDEVASHLFSLYFTWENPTWQLVDQHMFIKDLEQGSKRFCSSLLVHALLFFGCSFSYNVDRISNRREEKSLAKTLYDEIQRLWLVEKDELTLPTAQSSILIGLLCCTLGLDRIGTRHILHGAALCNKLELHRETPPYFYDEVGSDELGPVSRCHKLVAWAVFDVQALAAEVYRKVPVWDQPPSVCFSPQEAAALDEGVRWSPYPFRSPVSQPYYYTAACYRSALVTIVHEIALVGIRFPQTGVEYDDWEYAHQLYSQLLSWMAGLPSSAMPHCNTTPHILCLHLYYQATLVFLCDIFILHSKKTPDEVPNLSQFDPWKIKIQALDAVGSLILLYKQCHGWKSIPIVMLHYFCVAGVHAASQLNPHEPNWALVLESCVVGLWHMSLGWGRLCTAFLRTIELVLKATNPDQSLVPPKVDVIFSQLNSALWSATDISSLSADYVVHHVPIQASPSAAGSAFKAEGLEKLIRSMDHLSMK